jgi:predicted DNA-binding protein
MQLSINLDETQIKRLDRLAKVAGQSKGCYVVEVLKEHLDEIEIVRRAQKICERVRLGTEKTISFEEVKKKYGL